MKPTPDRRRKLAYHAQMFVLAVFVGFTIFATLALIVYALLSLGFLHRVPDQ